MQETYNTELDKFVYAMRCRYGEKYPKYKLSWKECDIEWLKYRLHQVVSQYQNNPSRKNIVDVANLCLMLYARHEKEIGYELNLLDGFDTYGEPDDNNYDPINTSKYY